MRRLGSVKRATVIRRNRLTQVAQALKCQQSIDRRMPQTKRALRHIPFHVVQGSTRLGSIRNQLAQGIGTRSHLITPLAHQRISRHAQHCGLLAMRSWD
jgi:hypothetical protein